MACSPEYFYDVGLYCPPGGRRWLATLHSLWTNLPAPICVDMALLAPSIGLFPCFLGIETRRCSADTSVAE